MMRMNGKFTGRKAAILFIGCFGIIITVNVILTVFAVKSFPGLDVKNSYVASQEFDRQKAAQTALGWEAEVEYQDETIILTLVDQDEKPVSPSAISLRIGRASTDKYDQELEMRFDGENFTVPHSLDAGKWLVFLDIQAANGTKFRQTQELYVRP